MRDNEALDILRAQGHAAGSPGLQRVGSGGHTAAMAPLAYGPEELHELAEGKLSFEEIRELREDEVPVERRMR